MSSASARTTKRRLAVTGGGTGGHVYPALAIIAAWREAAGGETSILYLGTKKGIESALVQREGVTFTGVESGPLRGKGPTVVARSVVRLTLGLLQAWKALGSFRPDALLATGGYVSIPVTIAARLRRIPVVVYLPDVEPGWAVRAMAPLARRVAVTSEASRAFLPQKKVVVTGYPARRELFGVEKTQARRRLGLDESLPTLLVMGGSRGAASINRAIGENLAPLLSSNQVIHISGENDESWLRERASRLDTGLLSRYVLYPYLHSEFPLALAAADLAVSRAGASVLGEYPAVGLPSILVPYPYAGAHQGLNAQHLAEAGASLVLKNGQSRRLEATITELLNDPVRLEQMSEQARRLSRPAAAHDIASLLLEAGSRHD